MPKLQLSTLDDWLKLEKKFEKEVIIEGDETDEIKENNPSSPFEFTNEQSAPSFFGKFKGDMRYIGTKLYIL